MSVIITMHQNISGQNKTDYIKGGFTQHLYIRGVREQRRGRSRSKKAINARDILVHQKHTERASEREREREFTIPGLGLHSARRAIHTRLIGFH